MQQKFIRVKDKTDKYHSVGNAHSLDSDEVFVFWDNGRSEYVSKKNLEIVENKRNRLS